MVSRRLIAGLILCATPPALAAVSLESVTGEKLFERNWISPPSSTKYDDGLGPLYDAPSCQACHHRAKGPAGADSVPAGTVTRLGNAHGTGDPVYGYQIQTRAVAGHVAEANPDIQWQTKDGLRVPAITLYSLGYGPLAQDTKLSLRVAPALSGVSLLAQVPESEILRRATELEGPNTNKIVKHPS